MGTVQKRHIQQILVRSIALTVFATLTVALVVATIALNGGVRNQVGELLSNSLDDTMAGAQHAVSIDVADTIMDLFVPMGESSISDQTLSEFVANKKYSSIDLVSDDGTIVHSSDKDHVGFNYNEDERTKDFLDDCEEEPILLSHVDSWPLHNDEPYYLLGTVVWKSEDEPLLAVVGLDQKIYGTRFFLRLIDEASFSRVGEHGQLLLCDNVLDVLSSRFPDSYSDDLTLSHDIDQICEKDLMTEETLLGQEVYLRARRVNPLEGFNELGGYLLAAYSKEDVRALVLPTLVSLTVFCLVLFAALVVLISLQMRRHVANRVVAVNKSLDAITSGKLDERVEVNDSIEFEDLSRGINTTVAKLQDLIRQEATRLDEELALARTIQKTALPNVYPPYPERCDFGLYASMDAAKEVGGDFYDFFLVSNDKIAVLVADVSDKGIPAAMFMMRAKTTIKALAVSGLSVDEVITRANNDLCVDNEADMFVTVWLGVLDLKAGVVEYVHAGHTCPVLLAANGDASFVKKKRDFVMGARAGMVYHRQELQLSPGDALFLYSDGVTEASSVTNEFYGSERLVDVLATSEPADDPNQYCEAVCKKVKADVDAFSVGTEPSDDVTTLCIRFEG